MKAFDRQYAVSALLFFVSTAGFLATLVALVLVTGAAGGVLLLGTAGALLCWFYFGRRPDRPSGGSAARWASRE